MAKQPIASRYFAPVCLRAVVMAVDERRGSWTVGATGPVRGRNRVAWAGGEARPRACLS